MKGVNEIERFNNLQDLVRSYYSYICIGEMDAVLIGRLPNDNGDYDWCVSYLMYARHVEGFKFANWVKKKAGWGGYDTSFALLEADPRTIRINGADRGAWEYGLYAESHIKKADMQKSNEDWISLLSERIEAVYNSGKGVISLGVACDFAPSLFLIDYIKTTDAKLPDMSEGERGAWEAKKKFIIDRRTDYHLHGTVLDLSGGFMAWTDFLLEQGIDGAGELRNSPYYVPDDDWY